MYQVIKMYGDCEPWWFLDGWEEAIISNHKYDNYEEALRDYKYQCSCLSKRFSMQKKQGELMVAFWDPSDQQWCDECDEYLQNYHSLLLMETDKNDPDNLPNKNFDKKRACRMKWKTDSEKYKLI